MKFPLNPRRWRRVAAVAGAGALVAGLVSVPAAPAAAQTSCAVDYQVTWDGGGGFGADVTITNNGSAIDSWDLEFSFPSGQQVGHGWSALWSQAGDTVTASNKSWNGAIGSGGSVTIGFNGSHGGTNQNPSTFFLNGVQCTGEEPPPVEDPAVVAQPDSLSIQGGDSDSFTVTLSEQPSGDVPVSISAGSGPVSVSPTSVTLGSGNWSTGASVTVDTTAGDANQTVTVTASAAGHDPASVSVTRLGDDDDPPPPPPGERVDNPYAGADAYVNPDWSAAAQNAGGPAEVYNQPTGVWLDRIAAIDSGSAGDNAMGLEEHLDEAVAQDQANGDTPLVFQVVIYNLPGRDCAALASNGELGPDDLPIYESDYIDVIADIIDRPEYQDLRVAAVIEIDSLPNLVTNTGGEPGATELCDTMLANGGYVDGVGYALGTLGAIPNVYNYVDAAHHGWIGWGSNFQPSAQIMFDAANANGASPEDVHGFITNTANYSAVEEPYIDIDGTVNGQMIRQSDWVDWNQYNAELPFAQDFRDQLVAEGFDSQVGMLIDTSRNGWGGPQRPDGASSSTDLNTFVDESRVDRRIHKGNWCNQAGAGLGERPQAQPAAGIDAYVWIKPPGESDGSSEFIENDEGKGFDEMCDPEYGGNARNGNSPSGALPDAPISGHWFQAQFDELVANAHPPL